MTHSSIIMRACADAQAVISAEFPELTLFFVPFEPEQEDEHFALMRDDIFKHPAADDLFQAFAAARKPFDRHKRIILGPATGQSFSFSLFGQRPASAACVFVPPHIFKRPGHALFHLLSAAYPVIEQLYGQVNLCDSLPSLSQAGVARLNMLGDWFGALAGCMVSRRPYIPELAKLRCKQALSTELYFLPEFYPAPLAYDAATLIHDELHRDVPKGEELHAALGMTQEIDDIIPPHFINKWIDFVTRAQKLAWGKEDPADILGMAVHTSEDIDIRAIAAIVADTLNIPANLSTYFDRYNPFTEEEANARHHKNACRALIKTIIWRLRNEQPFDFKKAFQDQNLNFIKHHPLGWCAPGIEEVIKTIHFLQQPSSTGAPKTMDHMMTTIANNFDNVVDQVPWSEISYVFDVISAHKRDGYSFSGNSLLALVCGLELEHYSFFEAVFAPYGDKVIYDAAQEKQLEIEKRFGNLQLADAQ